MKSLLAALFGYLTGRAAQKHMDNNNKSITRKRAKKLIEKDPALQENIRKLKETSDEIRVDTNKKFEKLPPESKEYLRKLFPDEFK